MLQKNLQREETKKMMGGNLPENGIVAGVEVGARHAEDQIERRKMLIGITVLRKGLNLKIQTAKGSGTETRTVRQVEVLREIEAKRETRIEDEE